MTARAGLRLDKWLWFARLCKSRSQAQKIIGDGAVRLNGEAVLKAAMAAHVGDIVECPLGRGSRQVEILALGERRGPAPEAALLYRRLDEAQGRRPPASPECP